MAGQFCFIYSTLMQVNDTILTQICTNPIQQQQQQKKKRAKETSYIFDIPDIPCERPQINPLAKVIQSLTIFVKGSIFDVSQGF